MVFPSSLVLSMVPRSMAAILENPKVENTCIQFLCNQVFTVLILCNKYQVEMLIE